VISRLNSVAISLFIVATFLCVTLPVGAAPLESTNYKLDAQVMNSFGGTGNSSSYQMVSSGGEAVVGNGAGGSYKLSGGYVSQLQQSIELRLNASQLQAGYQFDTDTGTRAYDSTASNSNGTMINGPTWDTGKIGQAVKLDGTNDYIDLGSPSAANITGDLTVSAWVKPASFAKTQGVISWGNGSTSSAYTVNISTARRIQFLCTGCTTRTSTGATLSATTGTWSHIAVTLSGSTVKFYLNGTLLGTSQSVAKTPRSAGNGSLNIGRTGTTYMNGSLDELNIFNRTLGDAEIRAIYDANMAGVNTAIVIPTVVPGASQNALLDMVVATDAGGYNAAISQNYNLRHTDNSTTVPNLSNSGTITLPVLWDEGTTKGLGLTLIGGSIPPPGIWGSGPVSYKYAQTTTTPTTFYSRTGQSAGIKETTNMQLKLDVPTSQKSGQYSNQLTVSATTKL